ncbi:hypothetical protein SYNPS1DRAFT_30378 [Syncephalis pseudoplumigaleata]|uniref:Uncharacterized protein n=1 Tax=Syncephalis pseudoplumigaleata TaxID=1712513 RepID=A0A4P9YXZ8_9FUNG|nr:hypothetical protein SYNPS1DRAFT_30378 [Syncephalis pseudoplumigaleata]|eukprot:RKP23860.1 hypothetical protein SYNPS1DRAFT_30378 [Syncephalis pseudoplumigaleata]
MNDVSRKQMKLQASSHEHGYHGEYRWRMFMKDQRGKRQAIRAAATSSWSVVVRLLTANRTGPRLPSIHPTATLCMMADPSFCAMRISIKQSRTRAHIHLLMWKPCRYLSRAALDAYMIPQGTYASKDHSAAGTVTLRYTGQTGLATVAYPAICLFAGVAGSVWPPRPAIALPSWDGHLQLRI